MTKRTDETPAVKSAQIIPFPASRIVRGWSGFQPGGAYERQLDRVAEILADRARAKLEVRA